MVMTHLELYAARNYLERAHLILKMSDCVQCEDILSEINQLDLTIKELGNESLQQAGFIKRRHN